MQIDVLGTEYAICEHVLPSKVEKIKDNWGYCDFFYKTIYTHVDCKEEHSDFEKKVLRHEVTHAFMHECAINNQFTDEQLELICDFVAIQYPKFREIFDKF